MSNNRHYILVLFEECKSVCMKKQLLCSCLIALCSVVCGKSGVLWPLRPHTKTVAL